MLREVFEARVGTALEQTLRENKEYAMVMEKTGRVIGRIEEAGLTAKQRHIVEEALEADNERGAAYGEAAYCQGFTDAVTLLMESWKGRA